MTCTKPYDTIRLEDDTTESPVSSSVKIPVYQEDHAYITPINQAARQAFHEIAAILKSDCEWNARARRFIHVNEPSTGGNTPELNSSDEGSANANVTQPLLNGHYRLNLAILPAKFANAWIIGTGRHKPTEANVDILISINGHRDKPHICNLVGTFYSDGDGLSMGSSSVNDVYMIFNPWAPQSLNDFAATQPTIQQLTLAYHQGALGIRHLQQANVIHRDIKPANILVSNLHPLCVVAADFGHATSALDIELWDKKRQIDRQNHMKGTISHHSPEIIALKDGTDMSGCWSKASDVFTYGVVGFESLYEKFRRSRVKHCIEASVHRYVMDKLNTGSAMDDLLASMLRWKASERPTIDQVLLKSVWPTHGTATSTTKRRNDRDSEVEAYRQKSRK